HTAEPIVEAVGDRRVVAVLCTHGHDDHVTVAPQLGQQLDAPVLLHPSDEVLWSMTHPGVGHDELADGQRIPVAGTELEVLHTPGHSPGSSCLYLPEAGVLCTGDTLFAGGPGATGRSYSDFPTIIGSIRDRLFALPEQTRVLTGHGDGTTIGAEAPHLAEWIAQGS
ncbi:MAG: MBL fold metallo-hydrolase, partial [Mycobacteriaceae bacterium]